MVSNRNRPRVALVSPFALYSGHHYNYTREFANQLTKAGVEVEIHLTLDKAGLGNVIPNARIISICPWLKHLHRWLNIDVNRDGITFSLLQNFETFACAISVWLRRRHVSAVYWQDARHQCMLMTILLLPGHHHACLVLGPVPFGGTKSMRPRVRKLYSSALATGHLRFITETKKIADDWGELAPNDTIKIPVAIGEPPANPALIEREQLGIRDSDFVCLLYGTHRADKDYRTVIRAAKHSLLQPFLLFAGPLISDNNPARILKEEGYQKAHVINRSIEEEEAAAYFSLSDCAILPYSRAYEKGSAVLLQACKYEIPVIAARSGHLGRFIKRYHTGVCYEPEDSSDLARAMAELADSKRDDPLRWNSALVACRHHFSWDQLIVEYLAALGITEVKA